MSFDNSRGHRRPCRENHSSSSQSPKEPARSSRRDARDREETISEEPRHKIHRGDSQTEHKNGVATHSNGRHSNSAKPATSGQIVKLERGAGGNNSMGQRAGRSRDTYEIVHTRPAEIISKKGSNGVPVKLYTNYYRLLTTPSWEVYQYHVDFEPECELRNKRAGILWQNRNLFGGYLYDGMKMFTSMKLSDDKLTLEATSKNGDIYNITIKFVGIVSRSQWQFLQVLNLIIRRSMEGLKLQRIGTNLFDPAAKIELREHRIQIWPGYRTAIRQYESDILLCAEIAHKVMRQETVLDIFVRCTQSSRDYMEDFKRNVLGLTVMTDYNNKTYRVDDVDFSKTPQDTFQMKDKTISFADYYYQRYNLRVRDNKQPLLISKAKERSIRGGENDLVVLVPEFCRATGLTDAMRSNFQLMRAMADHTRMNADRRIERLRTFNRRLHETPDCMSVLKNWNMKLDKHQVEVTGRLLDPQQIVFANKKETAGLQADWTRVFRDSHLFTTPSRGLDRWAVIATNRNTRELHSFVEALVRSAASMNLRIQPPMEKLLYDDRNNSYMQALEECFRQDLQLVLCLVPNNNAERYTLIKKKSCLERGVPTQIITQRTASNPRGLMSIATKVAIQINCKLGYTPWMVKLPLGGLMTLGYDTVKSTRDRSKSFGALVATMDITTNATFYSTVSECSSHDGLASHLWPMITKALRQYRTEHKTLPTRIVFYRDGVSEGSLHQLVEFEVKDIVEKLEQEYKRAGSEKGPQFAYIVVTKSLNTRFFENGANPKPGTIVDDVVTQPENYDFYLVSQSVRQGTVSPTRYNIVYSNVGLKTDHIQMLTYRMTHLYYNWSGTTRVPAVCQYAKKLATLVATNLFQAPLNILEKKLYYL